MSAQRSNSVFGVRMAHLPIVCLSLALAAGATWAWEPNGELTGSAANTPASRPGGKTPLPAADATSAKTGERLREGTRLIDVTGTFQSIGGDSVSFSPKGKDGFRVLENLQLQRVSQVLDVNKGTREWTVSGVITEYRGANYLLMTKAVQGDAATGQ